MEIAEYFERIDAAWSDPIELRRIADELQSIQHPDTGRLRFKALARCISLRGPKVVRRPLVRAEQPTVAIPSWLTELELPAIDRRPLYRYRLSDEGYERLQLDLKNRTAALRFAPDRILSARFVLWAAEWFRRCYDGTGQRWEALGKPLGLHTDWSNWRKLTDVGLRHWGIPELRINGTHHRLAAIARQGGFPLAAVEGQGSGWAPRFLERLVSQLLGEPEATLDAADTIAASLMELVPTTWRNQEIRIVSAELAVDVVRLRRLAEADGVPDGVLVSVWLDQHCPAWRDELPVSISSDAGRALIDGLMKTAVLKGGAGAVSVRRRLTLGVEGRRERTELRLDGHLQDVNGTAIARTTSDEWSRLRLFPAGEFAQHVSGELATAEPGENGLWIARPTVARSTFELPFTVSIDAELRGGGQRVGASFTFPGGETVSNGARVYVAETQAEDEAPTEFLLLGTGSGGYRPERIYIDLPVKWGCVSSGEGSRCEQLELGANDERAMWLCEGAAIATSTRGDHYLFRADQKGEQRDKLSFVGSSPGGCINADGTKPIYIGAPRLQLRDGRRDRAPNVGEVWWRPKGEQRWRANTGQASPGYCEFSWRDSTTGHIRDCADAAVLPADFKVDRRTVGDRLELSIIGWSGRVLVDGQPRSQHGAWRFPLKASSRSSCTATLLDGVGGDIELTIPLPHQAWIDDWSRGPVPRNERISLSTINRYVARTEGRCELLADLFDRHGRPVAQGMTSWWVDGELPLSTIRDDLAALLRPLGDIRAKVKLNFNDSHDNFWYVTEFDHQLERDTRGWLPDRAVIESDVKIAGRALHDPAREHQEFGEYGLISGGTHRPFELPTLFGDWLVYLRANERVLSCPQFIRGRPLTAVPTTPLAKAMAIQEYGERIAALNAICDALFSDPASAPSRAVVRYVIDLALSLDGLPPSTFDVLILIRDRPLLGAMMLFQALPGELDALARLPEGLPFAWPLIPAKCWNDAAQAQAEHLFTKIPDEMPLIAQMISDRRKQIADADPALTTLLELKAEAEPLFVAANAFINRSDDRIRDWTNPFRPAHAQVLPTWSVGEHFWRALDAPVAAALAVRGRITLEWPEVACIKDISRNHPRWFREAFVATLKESEEWQTQT